MYNHDARIHAIDTVRAYHFGERFLVEVDIVLPEQMPLREAHDIGQVLQDRIQALHQQAERHAERIEAQLEAQRTEMLELQRDGGEML